MRVALQQHVILERRRLALCPVGNDEPSAGPTGPDRRPLPSGREPRATSSAQPGRFDLRDGRVLAGLERGVQTLPTALS